MNILTPIFFKTKVAFKKLYFKLFFFRLYDGSSYVNKNQITPNYEFKNNLTLVYLPWMPTHGDKIIKSINKSENFSIEPIKIFETFNEEARLSLMRLSQKQPEKYRRLLLRHLTALKSKIQGVIVTFDWHPSMRILVRTCKELNIPTYLVLHESVFLNSNKYYWHSLTNIKLPYADRIIAWGQMQKNIFLERGVEEDRIVCLGAPKFDAYYNYQNTLSREEFCQIYNLNPNKEIFLYSLQPMDSQIEQSKGLIAQLNAINDLIDYCEINDIQMILREPPSNIKTIDNPTIRKIRKLQNIVVDHAREYLTSPEESIFHCDMIFSINSTMLFEATLMNKKAVSSKYIEFEQIWKNINLPAPNNRNELFNLLNEYRYENQLRIQKIEWAANNLSIGKFDGKSSDRIMNYISENIQNKKIWKPILGKNTVDNIICEYTTKEEKLILQKLFKAHNIIKPKTTLDTISCDFFIQIEENEPSKKVKSLANDVSLKPTFINKNIFNNEEITSYTISGSEAYKRNNINNILESTTTITIKSNLNTKIESFMNTFYKTKKIPTIKTNGSYNVLIIPEASQGDMDIENINLIKQGIEEHPSANILIYLPEQKYSNKIEKNIITNFHKITILDAKTNVFEAIKACKVSYVVNSDWGIICSMLDKEVNVLGTPFYAGYGFTNDKNRIERKYKRTREECFAAIFIENSVFYNKTLEEVIYPF